jgi:hypothetical protein
VAPGECCVVRDCFRYFERCLFQCTVLQVDSEGLLQAAAWYGVTQVTPIPAILEYNPRQYPGTDKTTTQNTRKAPDHDLKQDFLPLSWLWLSVKHPCSTALGGLPQKP